MADNQIESIQTAYDLLLSGNLPQATSILEELMVQDLENQELIYFLKCLGFWTSRRGRLDAFSTPFEKGEYIFQSWISYIKWAFVQEGVNTKCTDNFKEFVFSRALELYQKTQEDQRGSADTEVYRKIGLCYKMLGNYEQALRFLTFASTKLPNNATITADLADCYALFGENRMSKVLFREAFFIDAQAIDLDLLESEMIKLLIRKIKEDGYDDFELREWIPVFGVLYGVFNVKRELRAVELGKLKQACYSMENQLANESVAERKLLVPRLINHYFWLIDHYLNVRDDRAKMDEILLKIKILDPAVYEQYNT